MNAPNPYRRGLLALLLPALLLTALTGCSLLNRGAVERPTPATPANSSAAPALPPAAATAPLGTLPAAIPPAGRPGHIPPTNPGLRYTGRFDTSDPLRPRFDWPAVTIAANFTGTSLAVLLEDGLNLYNVTVDGQTSVLQTAEGRQRYVVASGLPDGEHSFRLTKRTETFYGTPAFLGLEVDPGRGLAPPPPQPARRIEFIGDSITAGYGSEGDSPTCTFSRETENAELTYAAMVAGRLDAAYTIAAVSGVGVVRNYNDDGPLSTGTMLTYYGRTTANDESENWDFGRWVPDAVVINLGTNDFSTTPHPPGEVFLAGYTDLVGMVRNRYPEAHIFAVSGPIMVDPAEETIQSVVLQMREVLGDERVHHVSIANTLELSAVDYGCDWHPNASGHAKIAGQLAPAIAAVMGW